MTAETTNQDNQSEDIDLLVLVERSLLFFSKYKWAFILAIIAGLSLGYFVYRALPNIYKSRLIVHPFLLSNADEMEIVDNWSDLLSKREYTALASALNCREKILRKIKKIKAEEVMKVSAPANPNGFTIDVNTTDNSVLDELQAGIVYGLENSEYVRQRIAEKRRNLQELISTTSNEILKLDTIKKALENIIEGNKKSSSSLIIDGSSVNRQLIEMNEKLLSFRETLEFTNAIQVLQGFSKFKRPAGPRLIPWLVIGLACCLCIAYLYALISSVRKKLKQRFPEKTK